MTFLIIEISTEDILNKPCLFFFTLSRKYDSPTFTLIFRLLEVYEMSISNVCIKINLFYFH